MAQCWPDGNIEWEAGTGAARCNADAIDPAEGRKSFPSGAAPFPGPELDFLLLL